MVIETKYNVGDDVWFMNKNQVFHRTIEGIVVNVSLGIAITSYKLQNELFNESKLFETKQKLIESL